jgi:hypothetical protein
VIGWVYKHHELSVICFSSSLVILNRLESNAVGSDIFPSVAFDWSVEFRVLLVVLDHKVLSSCTNLVPI